MTLCFRFRFEVFVFLGAGDRVDYLFEDSYGGAGEVPLDAAYGVHIDAGFCCEFALAESRLRPQGLYRFGEVFGCDYHGYYSEEISFFNSGVQKRSMMAVMWPRTWSMVPVILKCPGLSSVRSRSSTWVPYFTPSAAPASWSASMKSIPVL